MKQNRDGTGSAPSSSTGRLGTSWNSRRAATCRLWVAWPKGGVLWKNTRLVPNSAILSVSIVDRGRGMFTLWVGWYGFNAGHLACIRSCCGNLKVANECRAITGLKRDGNKVRFAGQSSM